MMTRFGNHFIFFIFFLFFIEVVEAQPSHSIKWYDAAMLPVQGKLNSEAGAPFRRFPESMEKDVRKRVWELSTNSAGLYIDFKTDATDLLVQYQVEGELAFPHMPATGVSGIDLYANEKNRWNWVRGDFHFGDTISYSFSGIKSTKINRQSTYRLYLPPYNTLKWMKIGVPIHREFKPLEVSRDKPVIVYGTSIVQGACASRPGMVWTSILGRKLGIPVINLGFSGNGRLEPEVLQAITPIEASMIVLDCMANFTSGQGLNPDEAEKRIIHAVEAIRVVHPETPVVLVEHAGYSDGMMQPGRKSIYLELNIATERAYNRLLAMEIKGLFVLKKEALGLESDSFVDGTHPNDHGMLQYANALMKMISEQIDELPHNMEPR